MFHNDGEFVCVLFKMFLLLMVILRCVKKSLKIITVADIDKVEVSIF